MSLVAGLLNVVLGTVYTSYGLMTILDMKRGWRRNGVSHFGMAWILMAFTCGPHHLVHGTHILLEGRSGGWLDVFAVGFGFPAGVVWFLLRVEAMMGGPGDRTIRGTPGWVEALPTVTGVYLAALATAALALAGPLSLETPIVPNAVLVVLYVAIGAVLLRTQVSNRRFTGNWSLSGLSLTYVFPTCALMHGVYALYMSTGRYHPDWHGLVVDSFGVPAAAYFLWVVWSLHRGTLHDWNEAAADGRLAPRPDAEPPVLVGTT